MTQQEQDHLHEILDTFATGVLITHAAEGGWHARPMAIAELEADCTMWFITGRASAKANELEADARAQVICQEGWKSCVALEGRGELRTDRERVRALWRTQFQAWFPRGTDDPDILLIQFRPESAEYWDNRGTNAIRYAFETVKAIATGERPRVEEGGQHGRVQWTEP